MYGVSKITLTEDVALITFNQIPNDPKLIAGILTAFAEEEINIDMVSQTAPQGHNISLSFTVSTEDIVQIFAVANRFREEHPSVKPLVNTGNCKVQCSGEEMREMHGVLAKAVAALSECDAEILLITSSEVDFSFLITPTQVNEVITALETVFAI